MYLQKKGNFVRLFFVKTTAMPLAIFGLWFALGVGSVKAQAFSEDFAVVPVPGWTMQNNSVPIGSVPLWFQGNATVFPAQAGATTAYIGANFNNTTGTNTISNWLITPNRTFKNGDVIKFWTRTTTASPFPDRLQVRLSTNGASTNVGAGAVAVGDFTTLLLDINPTYATGGVYPEVWTQQTISLSGLPAAGASGRVAFRYFVEGGGPSGNNSNFIGIDTFSYAPVTAAGVDVSGRVMTYAGGRGLRNALVTLTDQGGQSRTALTGSNGNYLFADVEAGQTYVISVRSRRFNYSPRVLQINDSIADLDFVPEQ